MLLLAKENSAQPSKVNDMYTSDILKLGVPSLRALGALFLLFVWGSALASGSPTPASEAPSSAAAPAPGATPKGLPKASQASREYHLKGAFLRYVAKYVGWPSNAIQGNTINLCVLGQVPVFEGINSINGKIVNDRPIQVTKVLSVEDAKSSHCQIVFVARTESDNISAIIDAFKDTPILGFGDMETYAQTGGAMNFYIANNHLAIMTNMPAVEKAKLTIDPQMLKLVTFVPRSAVDAAKPNT